MERSSKDNNLKFLQSLNPEWMPLSMSLQTTLDLANWTLSDLYGSLVSQESHITVIKNQMGGPLTLVGKASEGSSQKEKIVKKKKALVVESKDKEDNSDGEVDMKSIMKSLALITREYNRGFRRPSYRGQYEREDRGRGFENKVEENGEGREDR